MSPITLNQAGSNANSPDKEACLTRLRHQLKALDWMTDSLTEEQLRHRADPEKWSVFENMAHLARYQEVFIERLNHILQQDTPAFDRYVADTDPSFAVWVEKSLEPLREEMQKEREVIIRKITGLSSEALQRVGIHPAYGHLPVMGWAEFFLLHEAHHLFTIFKLTSRFRP